MKTTEGALTSALPEDILEAWQRLRETAAEFGEQRVYASHKSIMFAKKACYFFVRPTPKRLEVIVFLGRKLRTPLVRRIEPVSRVKHAHVLHITHRDQVEAPITDWLKEAYDVSESLSAKAAPRRPRRQKKR